MPESGKHLDLLVAEYYKWATGQGGTDPQALLAMPLSAQTRRKLIQAMNDANVALAFSEYVKAAVFSGEIAPSTMPTGAPNRG